MKLAQLTVRTALTILLPTLLLSVACTTGEAPEETDRAESSPATALVIAHRGASGYLPEHTLAAYALGHGQGADYVEPDLVMTRDGELICLHDIHLEGTTDVETKFPDRARDDGRYYAADFTLAEIRELSAEERLDGRFPKGHSRFPVPTFSEMIELIDGLNRSTGRSTGIYPELKAGSWHNENGLDIEARFLEVSAEYSVLGQSLPIFVQSFEPPSLRKLRELGLTLPLIQLIGGPETEALLNPTGLSEIAEYAVGIGPSKTLIDRDPELVQQAHSAGLQVHPYTFRADSVGEGFESFAAEIRKYVGVYGVDGLFTDFPDQARAATESTADPNR